MVGFGERVEVFLGGLDMSVPEAVHDGLQVGTRDVVGRGTLMRRSEASAPRGLPPGGMPGLFMYYGGSYGNVEPFLPCAHGRSSVGQGPSRAGRAARRKTGTYSPRRRAP